MIAAIGRAHAITGPMLKPGSVVIDVGMNRTEDGLKGDVDFEAALEICSQVTPVPGGVGPMTIAMLLSNTVLLAERGLSRTTTRDKCYEDQLAPVAHRGPGAWVRADIAVVGTDQTVVCVLFAHVSGPARNPAAGEYRSEEIGGDL